MIVKKNIKSYRLSIEEIYYITRLFNFYEQKVDTNHRLPEIYIGDFMEFKKKNAFPPTEEKEEEISEHDGVDELTNPDFLGFYQYQYSQEGKIFLYIDRIKKCANRFSQKLNLPYNKTLDIIKFIVLIHELGHWFTHWVCKHENDRYGLIYNELSKETKETMAQLNVVWALNNHKNLFAKEIRFVFYSLVDKQPLEYQQFLNIDKEKGHLRNEKSFTKRYTTLNRYLKIISNYDLILYDFPFLVAGHNNFKI